MARDPVESPRESRTDRGLPRAVDVALSFAGLVVAAPILVFAGLGVALSSKGPVLFRQERVGRDGSRFHVLKLRTMRSGAGGPAVTAGDDRRITPFGRLLRRTKVDELPQLWNVLAGDMALVGPRPEIPAYADLTGAIWRRVLEVRPGITDPVSLRLRFEEELLASVPGDRARFYREVLVPFKTRKYLEYQSIRSPWSDLRVLFLTVLVGLFPRFAPPFRLEDLAAPHDIHRG